MIVQLRGSCSAPCALSFDAPGPRVRSTLRPDRPENLLVYGADLRQCCSSRASVWVAQGVKVTAACFGVSQTAYEWQT